MNPFNQMSSGKQLRTRSCGSNEEMALCQLWGENYDKIPSYAENWPIFKDISQRLKQQGIRLCAQKVRRRLNSFRNKYLAERSLHEADPQFKSEWPLYLVVHCICNPTKTEKSKQLVEMDPNFPSSSIAQMQKPPNVVKVELDPNACPSLKTQQQLPYVQVKPEPVNATRGQGAITKTQIKLKQEYVGDRMAGPLKPILKTQVGDTAAPKRRPLLEPNTKPQVGDAAASKVHAPLESVIKTQKKQECANRLPKERKENQTLEQNIANDKAKLNEKEQSVKALAGLLQSALRCSEACLEAAKDY